MDNVPRFITVEHLPNGIYLVTDRMCQWTAAYRMVRMTPVCGDSYTRAVWQHGGADSALYRAAVTALWLDEQTALGRKIQEVNEAK